MNCYFEQEKVIECWRGDFGGPGGFSPLENFEILVKILHSGEFWEYLLGCLKEIFCDMLSYFILIIIAGSKYKCDSLMEDKKNICRSPYSLLQ